MRKLFTLIAICAMLHAQAQFKFDIAGATGTYITGNNDSGSIVGYCVISGVTNGFYYNGIDTLFVSPSQISGATAVWLGGINNHELAAGHYSDGTSYKPFMYNPSNQNITFPYSYVAPLATNYKVNDINDVNNISGDFNNGGQRQIWIEGPSIPFGSHQYFTGSGPTYTEYNTYGGHGLTNDNKITAWYINGINYISFLFDKTTNSFTSINSVASNRVRACGINNNNAMAVEQVVSGLTKGFRYFGSNISLNSTSTVAEIPVQGASYVHPLDINNIGHVCGWYEDAQGVAHGFYERNYDIDFRPDPNGMLPDNSESELWPATEWQNLDYTSDPYLGQGYPFPFATGNTFEKSLYPSWPLWIQTFGANSCYVTSPLGNTYLIPSAYFKWEALSGKFNGACYGMAANSIMAWDTLSLLQQRFPSVGFTSTPANIFSSKPWRDACNIIMTAQQSPIVMQQKNYWNDKEPREVLSALKASLADKEGAHPVLGIYKMEDDKFFGHAILPYKITTTQTSNTYVEPVYCYDPNKALNNATGIVCKPNQYNSMEWEYNKSSGTTITNTDIGSLDLSYVQQLYSGTPNQFSGLVATDLSRSLNGVLLSTVAEGSHYRIGDGGNYAGPWGNTILGTLTTARPYVPLTGYAQVPRHYYLQPGGSYSYELLRDTAGTQALYIFRDGLTQKFWRNNTAAAETDLLQLSDATLSYNNTSGSNRIINFVTVIEDTVTHASLTYIVDSLLATNGTTISTQANPGNTFYITNSGNAGYYDLEILSLNSNGQQTFVFDSIPFGANTSHTIIPNQDSLSTTGIWIIVDNGQNGSNDDTLFLQTQSVAQLFLSKQTMQLSANSGTDSIGVSNAGGSVLNWTVISKPSWVTITQGNTGIQQGKIIFNHTANTGAARSGLLIVEASGATNSPDTVFLTQDGAVSLAENEIGTEQVEVYPNPANDVLQIRFVADLSKNALAQIFDLNGRLVIQATISEIKNTISVSELNRGSYLLLIKSESGLYKSRFTKW